LKLRITKEILVSINEFTFDSPSLLPVAISFKLQQSLTNLLSVIGSIRIGKKLIYHYVIKPIYFQAGGRAKLLACPALNRGETNQQSLIAEFSSLTEMLLQLQQKYTIILRVLFNSIYSSSTIHFILEKLKATILYCGFTTLANDIISIFLGNHTLFLDIFQVLVSKQKYSSKLIPVRKLFRSVVSAASSEQIEKLISLVESIILRKNLQSFFTSNTITQLSKQTKCSVSLEETIKFLDNFFTAFQLNKELIPKEIFRSNRLQFSSERMLMKESMDLTSDKLNTFVTCLLQGLFISGLPNQTSPASSTSVNYSSFPSEMVDYGTAANYIEKAGKLLSVRTLTYFFTFFALCFHFYSH
jgi:hypothetical protein